jgi:Domain of unknown function (DUF6293)
LKVGFVSLPLNTLQIAILGGNEDAVLVGIRNFPVHKLILVSPKDAAETTGKLAQRLSDTLKLDVEIKEINDPSVPTMLETVAGILNDHSDDFEDFVINVGAAGKHLTCAGVTAAFVNGIKAFDVMGDQPMMLPVLKLSFTQIISGPKMEILHALEGVGGKTSSLEELGKIANFGKPLLSYHIRGSEEGRGLEDLGLVEVQQLKQGRLEVKLTDMGRMLLTTLPKSKPRNQVSKGS